MDDQVKDAPWANRVTGNRRWELDLKCTVWLLFKDLDPSWLCY